jgi:hypothetical protein
LFLLHNIGEPFEKGNSDGSGLHGGYEKTSVRPKLKIGGKK